MKQNLLKHGVMIVLATIASTGLLWADGYVEVVHDTIVKNDTVLKVDTMLQTDTIVKHDTCFVAEVSLSDSNERSFGYDFLLPLFVSVLGAFLALLLTYHLLRPKIYIDPILVTSLNGRAWFMVRNESKCAKLHSISAELSYFKYDEGKKDYKFERIELGDEDKLSMMYTKGEGIDSFYSFHTKYAFIIKDKKENDNDEKNVYDGVRIRVSATHAISGVFDTTDRYLRFNNASEFPTGEFINGEFHSIDELYDAEKLPRARKIVDINRTLSIFYIKFRNKDSFNAHYEEWKNAINLLKTLKNEEYAALFRGLSVVYPTITEMLDNIEWLEKLYSKSVVYTPMVCDKRDKYIIRIMRDNIQIALYMKV